MRSGSPLTLSVCFLRQPPWLQEEKAEKPPAGVKATDHSSAPRKKEKRRELRIGRGQTRVAPLRLEAQPSRGSRILRRQACGIESTAGHSSLLQGVTFGKNGLPSSSGPSGSSAGCAAHWRVARSCAWVYGALPHALWGSGVRARPPRKGQPPPLLSPESRQGNAASLLPSLLGWPEPAPVPVAAAAAAGDRGERGERGGRAPKRTGRRERGRGGAEEGEEE